MLEVLVGARGHGHHEHRRGMEEEEHGPTQKTPVGSGEKPDPQQRVSQVEEHVRPHQVKDPSKLAVGGERSDVVGFESEVVDDKRYKKAEQVNPVSKA